MKAKEIIMKYRLPIAIAVGIFMVWFIFFRGSGDKGVIPIDEFQNKLKEYSNGQIVLTEITEEPNEIGGYSFQARYNGFVLTLGLDKDRKVKNDAIVLVAKKVWGMNEISIGQYHDLALNIIRLTNPKLSEKDAQRILDNELNFNEQVMTGSNNTTSKNDLYYNLNGGNENSEFLYFSIFNEEKQFSKSE
ncbi:hypothetical protein COF68_05580 [Bacillus toyonensis]|uniref:hypothetical protein n=1 Tax=Bacillus toyonensis TaxID=155322 RepID=UPI000BFC8714|nr:hypothetical protein [Bacillus toyonensis]PHE64314.1 hypothetical protein COF68_05580 [Bacillus toyonensis]